MHCEVKVFKICEVARNKWNALFCCGDMTRICSSALRAFAKPSTMALESAADGIIALLSRTVVNKMTLYLTAGLREIPVGSCSWLVFFSARSDFWCIHKQFLSVSPAWLPPILSIAWIFERSHGESAAEIIAAVCFSHRVSQVEPDTTVKVATMQPRALEESKKDLKKKNYG